MKDTKPRGFVPMSKKEREQARDSKIRRLRRKIEAIEAEIKQALT